MLRVIQITTRLVDTNMETESQWSLRTCTSYSMNFDFYRRNARLNDRCALRP